MGGIPQEGIIKQFQTMYEEHWPYVPGGSSKDGVDCSGAFVNAYRVYGKKIAHGSNSIARLYVGELLPISRAAPGMAAFKVRPWTEDQKGNRWYGTEPGDLHHIGLVDEDSGYVLNAKGQRYGFSRDKLKSWDYVAYLNAVDYTGGGGSMKVTISGGNPNAPVRMRASNTTKSRVIAEIPQNSEAELLSEEGNWDKLTYDGKTGYVMAQFVHKGTEPTGDTVTVPKADLEKIYDQIGDWLGLRG